MLNLELLEGWLPFLWGLVEALKSGKHHFRNSSVDVGRIHFSFGTLQALGSHQNPRFLEQDDAIFLQCEAKIVRRHTSRQRSGVVSQQRLRLRRFDSLVKREPKLRFEPVSFLFLVCLSIENVDFIELFRSRLECFHPLIT